MKENYNCSRQKRPALVRETQEFHSNHGKLAGTVCILSFTTQERWNGYVARVGQEQTHFPAVHSFHWHTVNN